MIYIGIFLILACICIFDLVATPRYVRNFAITAVIIMLIILSGLRWQTGPDWDSYQTFFDNYELYRDGVYINMFEPGFTMINGIIRCVSNNFTAYVLFMAIVTISVKFTVFLKHAGMVFILIFLYYCYYLADIALVRQFTALSFTLLSSIFIINRRPFLFVLCVIVATSIHVSSIAFLGAYWIYHKKFSEITLIIILVVSFLLGLLNFAGILVEKAIGLLGPASIYAEKLLKYTDTGGVTVSGNPYMAFLLGSVKRAIVIPVLFYCRNKIDVRDRDVYRGYLNLLVIGNVIYFLFIIGFPVVTRMSVCFQYFEIFLIAFALTSIKEVKLKFVTFLIVVLFGGFRLYSFMAPYMEVYFPYKTILSK
ncbi:MAG: EpsG family protein [Mucilaginibacter sp.]